MQMQPLLMDVNTQSNMITMALLLLQLPLSTLKPPSRGYLRVQMLTAPAAAAVLNF
jgi:hypothetical protein